MSLPRRTARALLSGAILAAAAAPAAAQSVRVVVPEENFRKEPRVAAGNRLATVLEGAILASAGHDGGWTRVTLEGWIWKPSVETTDRDGLDLVVSKAGGENLREKPDGQARRLAVLARGMLLDSLGAEGNWLHVARQAWIWTGSVREVSPAGATTPPAPARDSARNPSPPPALPDRIVVGERPVRLLVSPDGDTTAVLRSGADLAVLARRGEWARVRLEGWVWEPGTLPLDSASVADSLSVTDLRDNPDQYVGRRVRWRIQFVSLERAEAVRTDFFEGEPFMLARPSDRSGGFVYVAVPPELLPQVERLRPLQDVEILARVRTGRSALMGVPIVDLIALQ